MPHPDSSIFFSADCLYFSLKAIIIIWCCGFLVFWCFGVNG